MSVSLPPDQPFALATLPSGSKPVQVYDHDLDMPVEYYEHNITTPEEIQSNAARRHDPLREFSYICRAEIDAMQKQLR